LVRVGVISDTHMPQRWPSLPQAVGRVFAGVDLILHAVAGGGLAEPDRALLSRLMR
jgi:predicted phosphodiesterase